jgi:hypothetical protein
MVKPPVSILILCLINSFFLLWLKFNKQMNGKNLQLLVVEVGQQQ